MVAFLRILWRQDVFRDLVRNVVVRVDIVDRFFVVGRLIIRAIVLRCDRYRYQYVVESIDKKIRTLSPLRYQ